MHACRRCGMWGARFRLKACGTGMLRGGPFWKVAVSNGLGTGARLPGARRRLQRFPVVRGRTRYRACHAAGGCTSWPGPPPNRAPIARPRAAPWAGRPRERLGGAARRACPAFHVGHVDGGGALRRCSGARREPRLPVRAICACRRHEFFSSFHASIRVFFAPATAATLGTPERERGRTCALGPRVAPISQSSLNYCAVTFRAGVAYR